jgi:hypothetical protein
MTGANINSSRPIPVPNALEEGSPGSRWQAFRDRIYTDPDLFTFAHCRHFSTENYFDLPGPLAGFFVARIGPQRSPGYRLRLLQRRTVTQTRACAGADRPAT